MEDNEIDKAYQDYVKQNEFPDNSSVWREYVEKMFFVAFGLGVDFSLASIQAEVDRLEKEKEK